jgi:hypothetical protein
MAITYSSVNAAVSPHIGTQSGTAAAASGAATGAVMGVSDGFSTAAQQAVVFGLLGYAVDRIGGEERYQPVAGSTLGWLASRE